MNSLCFAALLIYAATAQADDHWRELERLDELILAPRVSQSIEWAVDSSDAIVVADVSPSGKQLEITRVMKPAGKMTVAWPPSDTERYGAIVSLYQAGDEIMLCLRLDETGKSYHVYHYFPLIPPKDPRRIQDPNAFYDSLPEGMDQRTKMFMSRKRKDAGFWILTVDKRGKAIRDPDQLLGRVSERIAAGSRVPRDCDRRAVERRESVYGGWYVYRSLESGLSAAEFPTVLVPPEPEFRNAFVKELRRADRDINGRARPIWEHLINYRDEEVIDALKDMLDDRTVLSELVRVSDGRVLQDVTYEHKEGQASPKFDYKGAEDVKVVRTFIQRKRAYDFLRRMGVDVEQPDFTPGEPCQ